MSESGFKGLTPDELSAWKAPYVKNIISNNVLPSQGAMVIYGAEGRFKSMIALDLMYHIATGKDWFGFTTAITPTYYFQSEIPQHLLQTRSDKYRFGNAMVTSNCWMATDLYTKIDKDWGATRMEQELARTTPGVVIIDPLNNSTSAKLVDDYEVGKMLDRFNQWRQAYFCAVVLIHHNRQEETKEGTSYHYGTDDMFGTRIKKWVDTIIYIELTNDADPIVDLRLTFEKTRHAETKLLPIDIQVDRRNLVFSRRLGDTKMI